MKRGILVQTLSLIIVSTIMLSTVGCSSSIRRPGKDEDDGDRSERYEQEERSEERSQEQTKNTTESTTEEIIEVVDLEKPRLASKVTVNGIYYYLYWKPVEGVDGYCIQADNGVVTTENTFVPIEPDEGEKDDIIQMRTYKKEGNTIHYSEWVNVGVFFAQPVIADVDDSYESAVLDYNHLVEWLDYKGISAVQYTSNGCRYVIATREDPYNKGFLNTLVRAGGAYIKEYVNSIPNALENNLKSAILNDMTIEEYFNSAKQDASSSAIVSALGAAFADTSIVMVYRYNEKHLECAPLEMLTYLPKANRWGGQAVRSDFNITPMKEDGYSHNFATVYEMSKDYGIVSQGVAVKYYEDGDYYVVYARRSDYDPASPMRTIDELYWG